MLKCLFNVKCHMGRRLIFYALGIPLIKLKGSPERSYWLYFLFIPFWQVSTHTFQKISAAFTVDANAREYVDNLITANALPSPDFVEITKEPYEKKTNDVKLLAFYLTQFHTIPENDKHYERGFTEWSNVTKAIPHFIGHHQPQLPVDVGFYDLTHDDVMHRQIELAKMYGIHGFCFYYYWFSGTRMLERPLFNFLNNKELDLPFCLCWANENWSTLWDGGNRDVFMKNEHLPEDDKKFFQDILPFFQDSRYICINNKPLLIVYRPELMPEEQCHKWFSAWRTMAKQQGFEDLYIMTVCKNMSSRPSERYDYVDAFVEFPPVHLSAFRKKKDISICNYKSHLRVIDMAYYIKNNLLAVNTDKKLFRGVFSSWDNTARKGYSAGVVYDGVTPDVYRDWLSECIKWTKEKHAQQEQFVFINAWNEWAEGAHLEPDRKYGYAYLQATKETLEASRLAKHDFKH